MHIYFIPVYPVIDEFRNATHSGHYNGQGGTHCFEGGKAESFYKQVFIREI